jgi:hypothetical protein
MRFTRGRLKFDHATQMPQCILGSAFPPQQNPQATMRVNVVGIVSDGISECLDGIVASS